MILQNNAIDVRVDPPLGTIQLNRPDSGNALTLAMADGIVDAIGDLHLERKVRAVVLIGAGDSFCAGRDLSEMYGGHVETPADQSLLAGVPYAPQRWGEEVERFRDVLVSLLEFPKPVIAAVNGPVKGFGVALLLASDLVIATETARLALPDTRLGLVAGLVAPLLAYRAGASLAARLLLTATDFPAAEMHRIGLYHELVASDLLWARASHMAKEIERTSPEAVGLTKRLLLETAGERLLTDLTSGAIASAAARTTTAAQERVQAAVEADKSNA